MKTKNRKELINNNNNNKLAHDWVALKNPVGKSYQVAAHETVSPSQMSSAL